MPLYEFFCESCGVKFEDLCHSGVDRVKCLTCGNLSRKVLSAFRTGKSGERGSASSSGGCGG